MKSPLQQVRLRIASHGADISVHFEPTGMTYELGPNDWFDVTITGEGSGLAEVTYAPAAIVVGAWANAETTVSARDGRTLEV